MILSPNEIHYVRSKTRRVGIRYIPHYLGDWYEIHYIRNRKTPSREMIDWIELFDEGTSLVLEHRGMGTGLRKMNRSSKKIKRQFERWADE